MSAPLPTEADEDPRFDAALCACQDVWLTPWTAGFVARGVEHTRVWCRRLAPP